MFRVMKTVQVLYIVERRYSFDNWFQCNELMHGVHGNKDGAVKHMLRLTDLDEQKEKLPEDEFIYP